MTTLMPAPCVPTANDRLKESFAARVWLSLIVATFLHVLPFQFWPEMQADLWTPPEQTVIKTIPIGPVDLPAKPPALSRPLRPALATDQVVAETYTPRDWADVVKPPPPPPAQPVEASGNEVPFVPRTLEPEMTNTAQVQRALIREYPPTLRDAGIGGTVALFVHVDVEGLVTDVRIAAASGMASLDEAALRVAHVMRFNPAMNRDNRVAVWIRLPVTFRVR